MAKIIDITTLLSDTGKIKRPTYTELRNFELSAEEIQSLELKSKELIKAEKKEVRNLNFNHIQTTFFMYLENNSKVFSS